MPNANLVHHIAKTVSKTTLQSPVLNVHNVSTSVQPKMPVNHVVISVNCALLNIHSNVSFVKMALTYHIKMENVSFAQSFVHLVQIIILALNLSKEV